VAADVVLSDQRTGVGQAIEHLAELGHRSIGLATISHDVRPGRQSSLAFHAALERLGLEAVDEIILTYDRIDRRSGAEIAAQMLARHATAIVCCVPNSITAGVLEYLEEHGVSVPEDVSLVAFDESELASVKNPRLTVISRPIDELARRASRMVTTRLANSHLEPRVEVVATSLRVRGSTAPPPRVSSPA
jgi:LacI family transcriptional regulator